uniref:Oxidized low-density lipoprotein receptor 1-like isoform X3 n=1 Tax=Pogona vitticeps TaxID=103695 RepID=A0ABM5FUV7_9SAUR
MSQEGVTYADLRFVRSPPEKKSPPRELGPWTWPLTLALTGACLFLLASIIGVGIRYWQVSQQLQQASRDRAAEREVLAQKIRAKEHQLEEATGELSSHRLTLQGCEASGNRMQARLQELEQALSRANDSLALLREEKSRTEEELLQARSCQQAGCCPLGWEHFRQKCLWISLYSKNWEDSKTDCEKMSSRLVVLKESWEASNLWNSILSKLSWEQFWIGLSSDGQWLSLADGSSVDSTDVRGNVFYGILSNGVISRKYSGAYCRYIC